MNLIMVDDNVLFYERYDVTNDLRLDENNRDEIATLLVVAAVIAVEQNVVARIDLSLLRLRNHKLYEIHILSI